MISSYRLSVISIVAIFYLLFPSITFANPRSLPFTYPYETLAEGDFELEQFADMTPVRALASTGLPTWLSLYSFQTEFEYGITDRLEVGLYFVHGATPGNGYATVGLPPEATALKQRLRYRFADSGTLPIDLAVYAEIVERPNEIELETKLIAQRNFGRLKMMVNLWVEREFYFNGQKDWVFHPTAGATFELSPKYNIGLEYWMRAEYPDSPLTPRPFDLGPHHYAGPALMINFGKIWWSSAAYLRVSDFDHVAVPGESFGPIWIRSVVGIGL